jgi:two-component system chemotaxis response regulator CheY
MSQALNPAPPKPAESPSPEGAPSTGHLLLVDDSPTMRLFLRHLLLMLFPAFSISEAEDGKTALRSLTTARVDLIITDLQMPGMDGQSLVQVLRRNPILRKKPILVVSAALDEKTIKDLADLGEGGLACLAKPVDADRLHSTVLRLLA